MCLAICMYERCGGARMCDVHFFPFCTCARISPLKFSILLYFFFGSSLLLWIHRLVVEKMNAQMYRQCVYCIDKGPYLINFIYGEARKIKKRQGYDYYYYILHKMNCFVSPVAFENCRTMDGRNNSKFQQNEINATEQRNKCIV